MNQEDKGIEKAVDMKQQFSLTTIPFQPAWHAEQVKTQTCPHGVTMADFSFVPTCPPLTFSSHPFFLYFQAFPFITTPFSTFILPIILAI